MRFFKNLMRTALLLLLLAGLAACGKQEEHYEKVGSYEEKDNSEIPDGGYATLEDVMTENPSTTPVPNDTNGREYIIALDPGHGGEYSGATYNGIQEKNANLQHAMLLKEILESEYTGISVYMTRTTDEILADTLSDDLRKRVENAKNSGAICLISMHLNASDDHKAHGAMVCISKQPNIRPASEALANCILEQLEKLGLKNNGPYVRESGDTVDENGEPVDYYAINRHGAAMNFPAVILESCYLDYDTDAQFVKDEAGLRKLAEAEAAGIAAYLSTLAAED